MKKPIYILLFLTLASFGALSAPFNRINTVINTPSALLPSMGTLGTGISFSAYDLFWEKDLYVNYSLTDILHIGITRINTTSTVGNLSVLIQKDFLTEGMNLACGIDNITEQRILSTTDTYIEDYPSNLSGFIVASLKRYNLEASAGIGSGRFGTPKTGSRSTTMGLFYSAVYHAAPFHLMYEFDGKNANMGMNWTLTPALTLQLALTQLPAQDGNNLAYGTQVPYSHIAIGLSYQENLITEYQRIWKSLNPVPTPAPIPAVNKNLAVTASVTVSANKVVLTIEKEKEFLKYYQKSLNDYNQKQYGAAIDALTRAIQLNPELPAPYLRLGSIFWELNLKTQAIETWKKAYALDPYNEELQTLLKENPGLLLAPD